MDVIQVAALAVAGVLLAVQFKSGKTEYGIYLGLPGRLRFWGSLRFL